MSEGRKRSVLFNGWFIVAAGFLMELTLGEAFWSFGVFFKPLENDFGWSRSVVSSGYTAFLIGFAISIIAGGRLADRRNPRSVIMASALLAGLGMGMCSQVHSIHQLRLFLFLTGLGAGPIWPVAASAVMRWFRGRKDGGWALAITAAGSGVGAVVFAPLINYIIENHGWRNAFLCMGITFSVVLAVSALIMRKSPSAETETMTGSGIESRPRDRTSAHMTLWRTVTSPAFIAITLAISIAAAAFQAVSVHLAPYATDTGISAASAAAALGLVGGFSILGRLISGAISGAIGWQPTLGLALLGMGLSVVWLLHMHSVWTLYCFVFSYGVFYGVRIPAGVGIVNQIFGQASLGLLIGISTGVAQVAAAAAPYGAGYVFDRTGSYSLVFYVIMALLTISGLAAILTRGTLGRTMTAGGRRHRN